MKTKGEWLEFYWRDEDFSRVFHDRAKLRAEALKRELTQEEQVRLEAAEQRIDAYLQD